MILPQSYLFRYPIMILGVFLISQFFLFSEEKTNEINETTKNFWSNRPLKTPKVPKVNDPEWQKNPIDAFILSKLADNGLSPNPSAPRGELARRAYLNITGLAPTPEQVANFVADKSSDAWPKLVNQLLDSPQYGEKWPGIG